MAYYRIKSLIGEVAEGIKRLVEQGVVRKEKPVILYGLDRYSFAMRTILSNLGFRNAEGYISDDEATVTRYRSDISNFACRFLRGGADLLHVWTIQERLASFDSDTVVLLASENYEAEKAKLEALGYEENVHFYQVCDFTDREDTVFSLSKPRMTLPEIKQVEKEILFFMDRFCEEHDLRYWVCGGTLLGTIRHKGFIPWDDDIDIFLPWEDYQRLMEMFQETDQYGLIGFGTSDWNDYPDLLAKVVDKRTIVSENIGTVRKVNPLWIDVFPLTGLPDDAGERHLFFSRYKELNRQIWQEFYATNGDVAVFQGWYRKQREFLSGYEFDRSDYVGVLGTRYGERDCTSRKVYEDTLRMPFEDIEVNVPSGYKEYLDNLYGNDWMELPEENKRKTHHDMRVYWNIREDCLE